MTATININLQYLRLPKKSFFKPQIKKLISEMHADRINKASSSVDHDYEQAAKYFIEGLYQVFNTQSKRSVLSLPLNPGAFGKNNILKINRFSYRAARKASDTLLKMGWVTFRRGGFSPKARYTNTYKPSGELLECFKEKANFFQEFLSSDDSQIIVLKDRDPNNRANRVSLCVPNTAETRRMLSNLKKINLFLGQHCICLHISNERMYELRDVMSQQDFETEWFRDRPERKPRIFNFSNVEMRRIFSRGSMQLGGRFYGCWWQFIPSAYRPFITINGLATVEIDFASMHPHLLYLSAGQKPPSGDFYDMGLKLSYERRAIVKKYFNALINDERGYYRLRKEEEQILGFSSSTLKAKLLSTYPFLGNYLSQGKGLEFQYLDSQIAERVMLDLMDKGICCLPIHDSFIVERRAQKQLEGAMAKAYGAVVKAEPLIKPAEYPQSDFSFKLESEQDWLKMAKTHQEAIHNTYLNSWRRQMSRSIGGQEALPPYKV